MVIPIKCKWFALLVSANTRVKFLDGIASFKTLILYPERTFKTLLLYPERTQFELLDKKPLKIGALLFVSYVEKR